jgi:altronate hydrolase
MLSPVSGAAPQTLKLHADDDVAVAITHLPAGSSLASDISVRQDIPAGHKIAVRAVASGCPVHKYGQIIGYALGPIVPGDHVHSHNLGFAGEPLHASRNKDWRAAAQDAVVPAEATTFQGFMRADGRIATRNYLGIVTSVNCSATVARQIARRMEMRLDEYPNIDGVVAITHGAGCAMASDGEPIAVLRRTIAGYARHANFGGVLMLGLGCETNQLSSLMETQELAAGATLAATTIQGEGGTVRAVEAGLERLSEMAREVDKARRQTVSAAGLIVGLQCGGSDGYSGITANPALGAAVDLLVRSGGTAILSETPEIYGAEHLLTARAADPAVAEKLMARIAWWERHVASVGGSMDNNPSAGNKAGGLTTILEKSLGAVAKGGSTPLMAVYEYAQPVHGPGLVFMDTPGYDPVSATGQVAGGANMICFTTGRGSVYGCKPSPSLKLATNTALYDRMRDDMDINCGEILDRDVPVEIMGRRIFDLMLKTASGAKSRSEALGFGEDEFQPWNLGAVM